MGCPINAVVVFSRVRRMGNCNDLLGRADGITGTDLSGCIEFGSWSTRHDCRPPILVTLNVLCIVLWVRYMVYVALGYTHRGRRCPRCIWNRWSWVFRSLASRIFTAGICSYRMKEINMLRNLTRTYLLRFIVC